MIYDMGLCAALWQKRSGNDSHDSIGEDDDHNTNDSIAYSGACFSFVASEDIACIFISSSYDHERANHQTNLTDESHEIRSIVEDSVSCHDAACKLFTDSLCSFIIKLFCCLIVCVYGVASCGIADSGYDFCYWCSIVASDFGENIELCKSEVRECEECRCSAGEKYFFHSRNEWDKLLSTIVDKLWFVNFYDIEKTWTFGCEICVSPDLKYYTPTNLFFIFPSMTLPIEKGSPSAWMR